MKYQESISDRYKRYQNAKDEMQDWRHLLDEAYKYTLPNKNDFYKKSTGEAVNNTIYDDTAVEAVQNFANNIQQVLVPPMRRWANLEAGDEVPESKKDAMNSELELINKSLFKYIDLSNFSLSIVESFQELAVGTGFLLLNEGSMDNPLHFSSVPLSKLAVEAGSGERIQNVWRSWELPVRRIKREWPKAKLTPKLSRLLGNSPDEKVNLTEGTIYYPDNSDGYQYLYYVTDDEGKCDLINEFRSYSPWIVFRFSRSSWETLGRGPVITALSRIKVANKMQELELKTYQFRALPTYMAYDTGIVNPFTLKIEPGSIIPVTPVGNTDPIKPLPLAGDPQFAQLKLEQIQQSIRNILFANPIPALAQESEKSATEISILQQEWMRKNASSFGRLISEAVKPIIEKSIIILRKKGLIPKVELDGKEVTIKYESPLAQIQNRDDLQRAEEFVQVMTGTFGEAGLAAINIPKFPGYIAKKLRVDEDVVNNDFSNSPAANKIMGLINQGPQAQQQAQQQALPSPATPQSEQNLLQTISKLNQQPGNSQA